MVATTEDTHSERFNAVEMLRAISSTSTVVEVGVQPSLGPGSNPDGLPMAFGCEELWVLKLSASKPDTALDIASSGVNQANSEISFSFRA